ncbi:MAG: hypothetical protein ACLVL7_07700 [Anaerotruncus massiliensis (ex Togo et al. 2019)]
MLPYLAKRADHVLRSHCIYFFGIGESTLESQLRGEMQAMKNPTLAPYAKDGEVMLRVTASALTEAEAERLMEPVIASLRERYPRYIYGVMSTTSRPPRCAPSRTRGSRRPPRRAARAATSPSG